MRASYTSGNTANKPAAKVSLILFGSIFLAAGLLILYPITIRPLQKSKAAKSWNAVPATILSSRVKTHDSSDSGDTYSVHIEYQYQFNNRTYVDDRYSFMGGSSSGYNSKAEKVRKNPPGKEITVYVNPEIPSESVINRTLSWSLLFGLFPFVFILAGAGIMTTGFRQRKLRKLDPQQASEHVVILKSRSPIGKLIAITVFSIIWNGVVTVLFITDAPLLFKSIFGLAGILVIGGVIHSLLACFNPRPTVEITPGNLCPGTKAALRWQMSGNTGRIQSLNVTLHCFHVTTRTRRSGGETKTEVVHSPIFTEELFASDSHHDLARYVTEFTIPEDCPASRRGNADGIQWQLIFKGDIPKWPDIKEEFKFLVYPADKES